MPVLELGTLVPWYQNKNVADDAGTAMIALDDELLPRLAERVLQVVRITRSDALLADRIGGAPLLTLTPKVNPPGIPCPVLHSTHSDKLRYVAIASSLMVVS